MRNWLATAAVVLSLGMSANSVSAQQGAGVPAMPSPSTTGTAPQAPIGHRQPMARDVPPDLASPTDGAAPSARVPTPNRRGGGPPTLEVGSSCEAAGRGSVVLGRDKKACLGDETTAQDTLKQNWKYAATGDRGDRRPGARRRETGDHGEGADNDRPMTFKATISRPVRCPRRPA
jgi:hypothetical protein